MNRNGGFWPFTQSDGTPSSFSLSDIKARIQSLPDKGKEFATASYDKGKESIRQGTDFARQGFVNAQGTATNFVEGTKGYLNKSWDYVSKPNLQTAGSMKRRHKMRKTNRRSMHSRRTRKH
jgi:hypothetical protein